LILWEISEHMDWGTGDNAYPNMETITTGTGLNMKTLRTHRELAKSLGWLRTYEYMKKHGPGLAYAISFPTPDQKRLAAEIVQQALKPKERKVRP
jgi:hypothetical protein